MNNLLGVILCGGESKRMGSDKGLLKTGDTIWALSTAAKLTPFGIPLIFSINERQRESYSVYISPDQLVTDTAGAKGSFIDVKGPLRGLLSVHQQFPGKDLLLLACDMQDLDAPTIQKIIKVYLDESQYDFFVYQDLEFAQPFCGIYTSRGLAKECMEVPRLPDFSLQSLLNKANTKRLTIAFAAAFRNYNSHS